MASTKDFDPAMCLNLSYMKETLKELRKVDDNIMLQLNKTDTHSSKACSEFFRALTTAYTRRSELIQRCRQEIDRRITEAKSPSSPGIYTLETQKRLIGREDEVEEIIRSRSRKAFLERCRGFKSPESHGSMEKLEEESGMMTGVKGGGKPIAPMGTTRKE